jgi:hypothetical protein
MPKATDIVDKRAVVDLTADLYARAVIASAVSLGDDPVESLAGPPRKGGRRALAPAASALFDAVRTSMDAVCAPLGLHSTSVFHARQRMSRPFRQAEAAAAEAVRWTLKARPPSAAPAPVAKLPVVRTVSTPGVLKLGPTASTGGSVGVRTVSDPASGVLGVSAQPGAAPNVPSTVTVRPTGRPLAEVLAPMAGAPALPALSPRRASTTVGKPAPLRVADPDTVALGRHPADAAGQSWEARRVHELRGRGVPWAHIALQIGKSEVSLRDAYDPTFKGVRP